MHCLNMILISITTHKSSAMQTGTAVCYQMHTCDSKMGQVEIKSQVVMYFITVGWLGMIDSSSSK